MLPSTSSAARTALVYITVGALLVIWTGVWFIYLRNSAPQNDAPYYWCGGLVITGITLIVIGLGIGQIGRSAKNADHNPQTVITTSALPAATQPAAQVQPVVPVTPQPAAYAPTVPAATVPVVMNDMGRQPGQRLTHPGVSG
jgi:hypothetical protein